MTMQKISTSLRVIGTIHSPFKTTNDAPHQGASTNQLSEIEILPEYQQGLQDIDGFSHLHIFYWLHTSTGFSLMVHTPWDDTPHGLFATRSPHRPNPLGYAVVELINRDGNILRVKSLDAIDGTPVIDIKPYSVQLDAKPSAIAGWITQSRL
jgi:tRNA-Thr(GGU) m(6)t(6)A37 methyltransferase TsaA